MAEVLSPPVRAETPSRPLDPWRLMLVAVALPALAAAIDYALLADSVRRQGSGLQTWLQFAWYVLQVGAISYAVGRGVPQPVLRWFVFAWILLLVDLITVTLALNGANFFATSPPTHLTPAALLAGQIGLCVVWAIFGDGRWPLRLPAMAFLAAAVFWIWLALDPGYSVRMWTELLILQVVTLAVLCGLLRIGGFRLRVVRSDASAALDGDGPRLLQFNIKHVLIWTTALAVLLGILKGLDLLSWQAARELSRMGSFWKLTVAFSSAMVIIVALWSALGQGNPLLRYSVGLLFAFTLGTGLAVWSRRSFAATAPAVGQPWSAINWELRMWYEVGVWWLGWIFLSGGLLAATLMILRTLDYRLVRQARARN